MMKSIQHYIFFTTNPLFCTLLFTALAIAFGLLFIGVAIIIWNLIVIGSEKQLSLPHIYKAQSNSESTENLILVDIAKVISFYYGYPNTKYFLSKGNNIFL